MSTWIGAVSTDWNNALNWGPGGVPNAGVDAIFDATSTNPCITSTGLTANQGRACRNLITTGYTNILTIGLTAANIGYINVSGNITLGSSAGHIAGLSSINIIGATCLLDVDSTFTVPYLSFGSILGVGVTSTTTLVRSFAVNKIQKSGSGFTATVTAASAMSIDLTNGSTISGSGGILLNANVTLKLFGTTTYGNNITVNGNVTSQVGSTINLSGILNHNGGILNLSAGTTVPGTSILNHGGPFSLNMGTNELYSFYFVGGTNTNYTLLSNVVFQSCYLFSGGGTVFGAFNITVRGTVTQASHAHAGGKLILTGDGTSIDALATFSGTTMTVTAFTLGSILVSTTGGRIAIGQTITGTGIPAGTKVVAQLTGVANGLGTYQVSNSFTLGSTAIKGVNCAILNICGTTSIEIDALANAFAYLTSLSIGTFRYLSTNTGAYSAAATGSSVITTIDFQGLSSSTRFIRNLSLGGGGLAQVTTLLSDLWIENLSCISASGFLQSGTRTLYVTGNFIANNGTSTSNAGGTGYLVQPTIVLYGSNPCTFTCTNLNANIIIDKVNGTVTNTSNFNYATTANGGPYTFRLNNGTFVHGAFITTVSAAAIFNTPGVNWNSITVSSGVTVTINALLNITGNLLCSGSATFAGTHGWTTTNFTCTVANSLITLQNIVASSTAEYIVNGLLNLTGTLANRIRLEASGRTTFVGSIATAVNPALSAMTVTSVTTGTIATGMTVSQLTGQIPPGLAPFINDRPIIDSGGGLSWFINKSLGTRVPTPNGTINLAAGYKAKFTLTNNGSSTQTVTYVQTQDIDSSYGKTIQVTGSNGDDAATDVALFRTLNWGPLIATSGSVYYTFVN